VQKASTAAGFFRLGAANAITSHSRAATAYRRSPSLVGFPVAQFWPDVPPVARQSEGESLHALCDLRKTHEVEPVPLVRGD